MKAKFKTASNFKNANGIALKVIRANGRFIDAEVPMYGYDRNGNAIGEKMITASFLVSEVTEMFYN